MRHQGRDNEGPGKGIRGPKHPLIIAWAKEDAQKKAAAEHGMRSEAFRKACEVRNA